MEVVMELTDVQISEDLWTELMIADANRTYWQFPNKTQDVDDNSYNNGDEVIPCTCKARGCTATICRGECGCKACGMSYADDMTCDW